MTEETRKLSRRDVAEAYQAMAQNPSGQVVFADLMRRFAHNRMTMFHLGDTRPEDCVYREGQRSVLVHIGWMLDVNVADLEETNAEW